jgi:single-strand DNA-binding protein
MIHDAQVNLAGYVAMEPKFRKVAGDISSAKLRVAYTARRRDKETGEWGDGPTSFVNIQCWRTLADNVAVSVHKGEPVLVLGRLQIRRYEDAEGSPKTAVEIEATSVGHDLARGVAQFSRTRWPSTATADAAGAPAGAPGHADGSDPAGGLAAGAQPATEGDGVIDERAVAEFARELSQSFGASAAADPGTDAGEDASEDAGADAEVGLPA